VDVIALLWIIAIALLVFWVFGLVLNFIETFIWIFLVVGAIVLAFALFRSITGSRGSP
jgi:hypothetical protein